MAMPAAAGTLGCWQAASQQMTCQPTVTRAAWNWVIGGQSCRVESDSFNQSNAYSSRKTGLLAGSLSAVMLVGSLSEFQ